MTSQTKPKLIIEQISEGLTRTWKITKTVFKQKTKFQNVEIAQTSHGMTLFCDNERQSSELSQLAYHEGQVLPALLTMHTLPKTALIIGSSEGVVTQILQTQQLEKIVHIDIDEECLDACSRYLPYGYTIADATTYKLGTTTTKIIIGDGINYIKEIMEKNIKFDLIISDVPDDSNNTNNEPALYSFDFWLNIKSCLSEYGAFITQAGNPCLWRNKSLTKAWKNMHNIFDHVTYFEIEEQDWVWLVGHKFPQLIEHEDLKFRLDNLSYRPEFIDIHTIKKSTIPPIFLRTLENTK